MKALERIYNYFSYENIIKRKRHRRERKEWLNWAKTVSYSPEILQVIAGPVINRGALQSELLQAAASGDTKRINTWISEAEIRFFKYIMKLKEEHIAPVNKEQRALKIMPG